MSQNPKATTTLLDFMAFDRAGRIAESDIRCSALYAWFVPAPRLSRYENQNKVRSLREITTHYDRFSRHLISDRMIGDKYTAILEKGGMPTVKSDERSGPEGTILSDLLPLVSILSRPLYVGKTDAESGLSGRIHFHLTNDNSLHVKIKDLIRQSDPDARLTMADFLVGYINVDAYLQFQGIALSNTDQVVKDLEKTLFHFEMPPLNTKKGN